MADQTVFQTGRYYDRKRHRHVIVVVDRATGLPYELASCVAELPAEAIAMWEAEVWHRATVELSPERFLDFVATNVKPYPSPATGGKDHG